MTTFLFPPNGHSKWGSLGEVQLCDSSCCLVLSQRGSGAYFGVWWGPTSCRPCIFSLSVPFTALGGGPAEEGPRGHTAVKCNLCCRESLCAVRSKYYSVIASSKEELWRIEQLIGSTLGCFSTHVEIWPRKRSSPLLLLHTDKPIVPRHLSWPAVGRNYHSQHPNLNAPGFGMGFFFNIPFSAGNYWCDQSPISFSSFSLPPPTFSHSLRSDHLEILLHLFIMCEFPPRAESVTVLKCDALTHWGRKQRGVGDYNTSWPTLQSFYDLIIFISLYPLLCIPVFSLYPLLKYSHN